MNVGSPLTRELIQSNIADMDLDPDSLSQVDEAFTSAGVTWYQPLLLLLQYWLSHDQAILDHLLVARLTDAECEAEPHKYTVMTLLGPISPIQSTFQILSNHLGWWSVQTSQRHSLRQGAHEIEIALSFKLLHL